jgi:hypothetical protein
VLVCEHILTSNAGAGLSADERDILAFYL